MAWGLTAYGLETPNLTEWLQEYTTLAKNTFGSSVNLSDNSVFNKIFGIAAYQDT